MLLGADSYDVRVSYLEALGSATVNSEMLDIQEMHMMLREIQWQKKSLRFIALAQTVMTCFEEILQTQQMRQTGREELRIADLLFKMGNI